MSEVGLALIFFPAYMAVGRSQIGLPLTSSLLLEYSSEYLSEYSSTR